MADSRTFQFLRFFGGKSKTTKPADEDLNLRRTRSLCDGRAGIQVNAQPIVIGRNIGKFNQSQRYVQPRNSNQIPPGKSPFPVSLETTNS